MSIQRVGLPFDTDTPVEAAFVETAVLPDGNVVAVQRLFNEVLEYTVFSPDGEVINRREIDVASFGDRVGDIAVRPDGSLVLLYLNAFGNRHVQLLDKNGDPLADHYLVWPDGGLASHIDVAADGSFTFTAVTAWATGYNGGTVLARFDAKGTQIGTTEIYHEDNGHEKAFAGQHDTQADGTVVIARTEEYVVPHPTSGFGEAEGVSVDLVDGANVTNIDIHIPKYVLHNTVPPSYQMANTADVGNAPQVAVLDSGGFAVSYRINVGVGNSAVPTQFIRFFNDKGGNATDAYALFEETDDAATLAAGEFWMVPVTEGRVAVVWTHTIDKTVHVEFVWQDKSGAVVSEEAQIGTARGVGSFGSGAGIFAVNAAPDGSLYITMQQADPDSYVTLRVIQGNDGKLSVKTGADKAEKINGTNKADLIDAEAGRDVVNGKQGNDTIWGGAGNDDLRGAKGHDDLHGGSGKDTLQGVIGHDKLDGGDGDDILIGGTGADELDGGRGRDTASYEDARNGVVANLKRSKLNEGDAAGDTYIKVENLTGSRKSDTLVGNGGNNVIKGAGGADVLSGDNGKDRLEGGGGKDKLSGGRGKDTLDGGSSADVLAGGSGPDTLNGGGGRDKLDGGGGADHLAGGAGRDILTGGGGGDIFQFKALSESTKQKSGRDVITDFSHHQGDKIDLREIDATGGTGKNNKFKFIADNAFSGAEGELGFEIKGKKTFVYGDVNGDKLADFAIELAAKIDLVKSDFHL